MRIGDDAVLCIVKSCNGVEQGVYKFVPGAAAATRDGGQERLDVFINLLMRAAVVVAGDRCRRRQVEVWLAQSARALRPTRSHRLPRATATGGRPTLRLILQPTGDSR